MLTGLKIDISYSYIAENVLTYIFMYQFCLSLLRTSLFVVSSLQPFQYLFGLATWPSNKISRKSLLLAFQNPNASLDTDAAETTEMSSAVGDSSDCNYRYHRERKKNFFNPLLVEKLAERSLFFQRIEIFFLPVFEILTLYNKTCMC